MKIALSFPFPAAKPEFVPSAERFCETFATFPPGEDVEIYCTACNQVRDWSPEYGFLRGLLCQFRRYDGKGFDIGCHIDLAQSLINARFDMLVCVTTQTFFRRSGWLKRVALAWELFGPGLYAAHGSLERSAHLRTNFFACPPSWLAHYPHVIDSKERAMRAEWDDCCSLTRYAWKDGLPTMVVTWDGAWALKDWRSRPNIYRRGDQSNCIAFDKYTDLYEQASPEEKRKLEQFAGDK